MKAVAPLIVCFISGCSHHLGPEFYEHSADSAWSIQIPQGLVPSNDLHDFASIQFASDAETFYVIGLSEEKTAISGVQYSYTLEDYAWFSANAVCARLDTCFAGAEEQCFIGGCDCITAVRYGILDRDTDPLNVSYRILVCEGDQHFYQVLCWTTQDKAQALTDVMDRIVWSFRELPQPSPQALGRQAK